jgi:hypothetical protein
MARWDDVAREEPAFAEAVQRCFDAHKHKMLGTLRADGSPRLSGIEANFVAGDLWLGMMDQSRKALDLRRDPRLALHSTTADPEMTDGDARISGRGVEIDDDSKKQELIAAQGNPPDQAPEPDEFHLFRVDIAEVVRITLGGDPPDRLVIETWREGGGLTRVERQ